MQVVILCGGKGTRLSEYTDKIPKPLIDVGGKPILLRIMEHYSNFGYNDFILCLGYKGNLIKDYFSKSDSQMKIQFIETGLESNKAERIQKAKEFIRGESFFLAYGDDLSDVDINRLLKFHKKNKKIVTLTAVDLTSPFGIIKANKKWEVTQFREKPKIPQLMNGGFYVVEKRIFGCIKKGYDLERETFEYLARKKQISAFYHKGFWKSMNTLKDVIELNEMFLGDRISNK